MTTEERSFGQSCNAQILIWQTILHLETQLLYESFLAESQPQMSDTSTEPVQCGVLSPDMCGVRCPLVVPDAVNMAASA